MLKVSFGFNNIQKTLQRHYRRGQTILSLEQNVLEDRWNEKDNTGETVLPFDQKTCFDQKSKLLPSFLTKILLK